jgi:prepilin-type N-terminal cleavage/methylation domain-containing protein
MRSKRGWAAGTAEGFSLSELLVVIALMGLFILFGGPAMADAYRAYKVRSVADVLATDIRAMRYTAVATRAPRSMTINTQGHATAPNQYTFTNAKGETVTRQIESGVNLEDTSSTAVDFSITGGTGSTATLNILVSMGINSDRGDRYTISVTPTGTVSTSFAYYTP